MPPYGRWISTPPSRPPNLCQRRGAAGRPGPYISEQRWRAIGRTNGGAITVVYTLPQGHVEPGRIISTRRSTRMERTKYEEGYGETG